MPSPGRAGEPPEQRRNGSPHSREGLPSSNPLVPTGADPGEAAAPRWRRGLLVALALHPLELDFENLDLRLDRGAVPLVANVAVQLALEGAKLRLDLEATLEAGDHDIPRRSRRGRASSRVRWPAGDLFGTIVLPEGSVIGEGVVFPMRRQTSMIL